MSLLADAMLRDVSVPLRDVLERSLEDRELDQSDVLVMLAASGRDLQALCMVRPVANVVLLLLCVLVLAALGILHGRRYLGPS